MRLNDKEITRNLLVVALVASTYLCRAQPETIRLHEREYSLAFSDEFNQTKLDTSVWDYRTDSKHWSTQLAENVTLSDGFLHLNLKKEDANGKDYTGAGLISKIAFQHGYYEARLKVPPGAGWHTSFWLMHHNGSGGTNTDDATVEIDILEHDSKNQGGYHANIHRWQGEHIHFGSPLIPASLAEDFQILAAEYAEDTVYCYLNGQKVWEKEITDVPQGPIHIWLTSIASFLGDTEAVDDSQLPAAAVFDYVRFYKPTNNLERRTSISNLALNQTVRASTEEEPATAAVDGNPESYWQSAGTVGSHWLEISLDETHTIDQIVLPLVKGADSLVAEAWMNEQWQEVGHLPTDNPVIAFEPVNTDKLRLRSIEGQPLRIYEVQVFAHDPQPVLVNQVGYDLNRPKRFTAPLASDGTPFRVVNAEDNTSQFEGSIQGNIGDFTDFRPDTWGNYQIVVEDKEHTGRSVPFWVSPGLIEQISYQPAIDFMVDVRCWFGDSRSYSPTDSSADCPNLGVAWRDSHQFSFEIPSLLNLYFANPEAFSTERMPVQGLYLGVREELPEDTPEIVRLAYWAVDIYLRGKVNHTLLKEQLAYFLYAYPYLEEYIPRSVYDEARDYLFGIWGNEAINRWQWHDIEHSGDLFQVYDFIGTGKGQFPPGHSVIPNLMMHEVALREGRADEDKYFQAAYDQTQWLLDNLNWTDPRTTKGQRQGEHVTITSLAYFQENYPQRAPRGIDKKISAWADEMIRHSDNLWDYRRYSDDKWIIPTIWPDRPGADNGFNEVGNIAGFPAPALAAIPHIKDTQKQQRLEELAIAYVDHIFGRNPAGRHFGFDATTDFAGVELGWYKEWQGGAGILQTARGVLDGSPKETIYPYHPEAGDPGHTEGWVTFNTAWNTGLAYLSSSSTSVKIYNTQFSSEISQASTGDVIGIELIAPLNANPARVEQAQVVIHIEGKPTYITLTETGKNTSRFRTTWEINAPTDEIIVSYGLGWHQKTNTIKIR